MKKAFITLIFFTFQLSYSQTEVELFFKDDCKQSIVKTEYNVLSLDDSKSNTIQFYNSVNSKVKLPLGQYMVSFGRSFGEYFSTYFENIKVVDLITITDTLVIPKILFTTESGLYANQWNYYNCQKLCEGKEIDYYPNGNKRLEGLFKEGKPIEIVEYRTDGIKQFKYFYKFGTMHYLRVENYNEKGELEEYEIHKNKLRKTIKRIYTPKGKFLRKEISKYTIVK